MTPQTAFRRKIGYLVAIAALLALLSFLGRPATRGSKTEKGSPGGLLAEARDFYDLSQAELGEIDPTSETIKLATLGMRGVATIFLWEQANTYKMKKDWTNLSAVLEQIARLQPNFISVWEFQSWNLSYNVSAEFDDFRQRYHWVIRGIKFLEKGTRYNDMEPKLLWDMGWTISQKIGKSDEKKQFRRLFKQDDDFHDWLPFKMQHRTRDNWLVGQQWYIEAERLVDEEGASIGGKSPVVFRSEAPMCQMNYATAVEEDGRFGRVAGGAWEEASRQWQRFGALDIPTAGGEKTIRLNDKEGLEKLAADKIEKLDAMQPGLREEIIERKRDDLPAEQREALDTPNEARTQEQWTLAAEAEQLIRVSHEEVARNLPRAQRAEALKLAKEAQQAEDEARFIGRYRDIVNFEYWRRHAKVEQDPDTLDARRLIYYGRQAMERDADLDKALKLFEEGLRAWRRVFDKYPELLDDDTTVDDTKDIIESYRRLLHLRDTPFPKPEDFILQDVLDADPEN
jgi:hypothetical protein